MHSVSCCLFLQKVDGPETSGGSGCVIGTLCPNCMDDGVKDCDAVMWSPCPPHVLIEVQQKMPVHHCVAALERRLPR